MRIGSLCSGYGGLEMGAQAVLGGTIAWHAENDKAASAILAHHHPDVPNHGDITRINWSTVEPVDVLTAGFPCQPVSHAGKRLGDQDERWLWDDVARAVRDLRPRLVVLENVRGLLTAGSGRLFGQVLGDLAHLGYDTRWVGVRASDVGAPHGRFRVFVTAHPTGGPWGVGDGDDVRAGWGTLGREQDTGRSAATDTAHLGHERGRDTRDRRSRPADSPGPAADTDSHGPQGLRRVDTLRRDTDGRGGQNVAWGPSEYQIDSDTDSLGRLRAERWHDGVRTQGLVTRYGTWGDYEPAIRRWEHILGRLAPPPTELGAKGQPRLSPRFVEWMMGLPAGHVTDVPGISRNDQLKILGNGVMPQQAALALRHLLHLDAERAA